MARAAARARRVAVLEGGLKGMYRSLEAKPVPPRLAVVVDALQEGEELAAGEAAKGRAGASAGS